MSVRELSWKRYEGHCCFNGLPKYWVGPGEACWDKRDLIDGLPFKRKRSQCPTRLTIEKREALK